jgi:hypothetical protein
MSPNNQYFNNAIGVTNELPIYIYLKFAYQTTNVTFILSRNLTLREMVQRIREKILSEFGVADTRYELVQAGQNMPPGIPSEEAAAFDINNNFSANITIRSRFNEENCIAFYIRMLQVQQDQPIEINLSPEPEIEEHPSCMICFEANIQMTNYYGCSHLICDACCAGCIQAGISRCALCRHERYD